MMRRQVTKALETLRMLYERENPKDSEEYHMENVTVCGPIYHSIGCLEQTIGLIAEVENNEEDWEGVKEVEYIGEEE